MALPQQLREQVVALSQKVTKAEKIAEKQVKQILKSTERFRGQQLKKVQVLIKQAERLKSGPLVNKAKQVRSSLESSAALGIDYLMNRLDIPTKKEIERLNKKVAHLQKKIESLEKSKSSQS